MRWSKPYFPPVEALHAARDAEPSLLRGLLLEELPPNWLKIANDLECTAVILDYNLWTSANMLIAKKMGFKTLSYSKSYRYRSLYLNAEYKSINQASICVTTSR
jgi:hypothetical protein